MFCCPTQSPRVWTVDLSKKLQMPEPMITFYDPCSLHAHPNWLLLHSPHSLFLYDWWRWVDFEWIKKQHSSSYKRQNFCGIDNNTVDRKSTGHMVHVTSVCRTRLLARSLTDYFRDHTLRQSSRLGSYQIHGKLLVGYYDFNGVLWNWHNGPYDTSELVVPTLEQP
jgi:hypothetical protein